MPGSIDVYGDRPLMCCKIALRFGNLLYGFHTNTSQSEQTLLGQIPGKINGAYRPGLIRGIDAPKPAKFEIIDASVGHDSSFADYTKYDDLFAAGWKMKEQVYTRTANDMPFSDSYFVTWRVGTDDSDPEAPIAITIRYAFPKPDWNSQEIGTELSVIGVERITDKEDDVFVWGSDSGQGRKFKPNRASKRFVNAGGSTSRKSSFISSAQEDTAAAAGWTISRK